MNIIDIVIIACLIISVVLGFRDGVIRQLGVLVGIIVAIVLAKTFGATVGAVLGIGGDNAHVWGFAIVLILSLIGVGFIATVLRKIISAVGLGILDRIAGGALGFIKCALVLSLLLSVFNFINSTVRIVDTKVLKESQLYEPISSASQFITPAISWVEEQLPLEKEE